MQKQMEYMWQISQLSAEGLQNLVVVMASAHRFTTLQSAVSESVFQVLCFRAVSAILCTSLSF